MKVKLFEIVTDEDKISLARIQEAFNSKNAIRDWAFILHDKDDTRPHYHIAVRLKNSYDTKYIAEWFGVAENFVSRVKGRWSDMLKYLTHENRPEKYQYKEDEVLSNFDWKTAKENDKSDNRLDEIIDMIEDGSIREYNYFDNITTKEYVKYKRSIDIAFSYRLDKLKGAEREMDCIFITGDSGVGKTTYAKQVAGDNGYSVFVSSGSNDILDDYKGQDCVILDDLRPSCLGLSDLLKMLDNHTASTVKSRYKNKVLECKMIIITTTLDIDTFFKNVFSDDIETSIQLKRRCETHITMEKDYLYVKAWQKKSRVYGKAYKFENPVSSLFKTEDLTEEEQLERLSKVLGGLKGLVDDVKDNIDEYIERVDGGNFPFDK